MAKVIGYDETVKKRCTCRNCAAVIEYVANDIIGTKKVNWDYLGDYDVVKYLKCPACSSDVQV